MNSPTTIPIRNIPAPNKPNSYDAKPALFVFSFIDLFLKVFGRAGDASMPTLSNLGIASYQLIRFVLSLYEALIGRVGGAHLNELQAKVLLCLNKRLEILHLVFLARNLNR